MEKKFDKKNSYVLKLYIKQQVYLTEVVSQQLILVSQ